MNQTLWRPFTGLVWLTLAASAALRADVTLRYETKVDLNPNLPPQFAEQMTKSMNVSMPAGRKIQLKDGKLLAVFGNFSSISDFNKGEITLIDPAGKRYGAVPADQYSDIMLQAMPAISDQAKAGMAAMKAHTDSKATGRTATIQGIEGEEREIDVTMDAPSIPNAPPRPMFRMVVHVWMAKADEGSRVPAVAEMSRYDFMSMGIDPLSMMSKQMPGLGDAIAWMKEMKAAGSPMLLRMQMEMFMPMLTALLKQMPGGANSSAADSGAEAPTLRMSNELTEVSTAPIPDSVFQIPQGYQSAPAAEILRDMVKEMTQGMQPKQ